MAWSRCGWQAAKGACEPTMARVLIIDDDRAIRNLIAQALSAAGHDICTARNGAEGILLFQAVPFDAVFCDIVMPEMDGIATISEIRSLDPHVHVVAMSGADTSLPLNFLELSFDMGANKVIRKPFSLTQLLNLMVDLERKRN
jgi:CheY-like chemotaxis protein